MSYAKALAAIESMEHKALECSLYDVDGCPCVLGVLSPTARTLPRWGSSIFDYGPVEPGRSTRIGAIMTSLHGPNAHKIADEVRGYDLTDEEAIALQNENDRQDVRYETREERYARVVLWLRTRVAAETAATEHAT
jgi:hypothetical protein